MGVGNRVSERVESVRSSGKRRGHTHKSSEMGPAEQLDGGHCPGLVALRGFQVFLVFLLPRMRRE